MGMGEPPVLMTPSRAWDTVGSLCTPLWLVIQCLMTITGEEEEEESNQIDRK